MHVFAKIKRQNNKITLGSNIEKKMTKKMKMASTTESSVDTNFHIIQYAQQGVQRIFI